MRMAWGNGAESLAELQYPARMRTAPSAVASAQGLTIKPIALPTGQEAPMRVHLDSSDFRIFTGMAWDQYLADRDVDALLASVEQAFAKLDPPPMTDTHKRSQVPLKRRWEVLRRAGFRCSYCGGPSSEVRLHVDHLIPLARGGSNDLDNLIAACSSCNAGKGAS